MKKVCQSGRFGKPRILVIGCGDVGMRLLPHLCLHYRVFALTSQQSRCAELRAAGAQPIVANLDDMASLRRLAGLARTFIHLAPPTGHGALDARTRRLTAILPEHARLVYISTTGVYGDCDGATFDETRPVAPASDRAQRRVDAETTLRVWAKRTHSRLMILRVPGIYAHDRLPLERLRKGIPALTDAQDVHTNHVHAEDLARIIMASLQRGRPQRVYHAVDDTDMKMGEYFDAVADAFGLPRPERVDRERLRALVSPMALSFMQESRRLVNERIKRELGVMLRWPTVSSTLSELGDVQVQRPSSH